jgi:hypothetical protein
MAGPPVPIPQPITVVVQPPSLTTLVVPIPPDGCAIDTSYDNTQISPPGSIFRGQTGCGSGIYQPGLSGQAVLKDIFGSVVAVGNGFSQVGGIGTSQGIYLLQGNVLGGVNGVGPLPGSQYTITYDTSITLTYPQYWGPPAAGCSVNGQTLHCVVTTTYSYIPGTQGGIRPS